MMTSTDPERLPDARDLFEVRTKILQQTNPLRAKILVFSVVYRIFDFSTRDWLALKSKEFYALLKKLYANFSTFLELEEKLYEMAKSLDRKNVDDEKTLETARVVVKYMRRLYNDIPESNIELDNSSFSEDEDETQLFDTEATEIEWKLNNIEAGAIVLDRETSTHFDSPVEFENVEDTSQTISYANSNYDLPDSQLSCDDSEDLSEIDRPLDISENRVDFELKGNFKTSGFPVSRPDLSHDLEIFKIADRVADSLFRKLNLQEEIENLVNQQFKDSTLAFQNTLAEVESRLEDRLMEEPAPEGLLLKYQALQMLTDKLQSHFSIVKEILAKQEMDFLSTAVETDTIRTTDIEDRFEDSPKDEEVANPISEPMVLKAWISMLDLALKNRGITTLAKVKNGCLYLVFESSQELNPKTVVAFVNQKIVDLELGT
ncbi:hypothetical protein IQ235_16535, partial [Oscillatoriales cyanobacterium LEGE 11467]